MRRQTVDVVDPPRAAQCSRGNALHQQTCTLLVAEQRARAAGCTCRCRVRGSHQRRQQGAFDAIEPGRAFAEETARRCIDTFELAAERRQVEPRFEYLGLAPVALDRERLSRLPPLLDEIAVTAAFERWLEMRRELHRYRAAAAPFAGKRLFQRCTECAPVDPAVLVVALVFRGDHEGDHGR